MLKKYLCLLGFVTAAVFAASVGCNDDSDTGGDPNDHEMCQDGVCVLSGTYTEDMTLTADKQWLLRGGVFIGDDVTETVLTIEPGTRIYGETATTGMLVIRRHSKIIAEGTREAPIVFTSSKAAGSRARGDWGGVIINGLARVNSCGDSEQSCEAFGEGGTGYYGGDDDNDDSGVMRYVRIEFAGKILSPDNELNGLALQGVGSQTTLDYIQVHMGKDDGIEFFGGTCNFKHVLVTGVADDNLDWTDGWRGKGQFFVCQQYDDGFGDNGIEADNNGEDNSAVPRSGPVLSNLTLIGAPESTASDIGMLLREGTGAQIHNAVVVGWGDACLDIDHGETFENAMSGDAMSGQLTLSHSILSCANSFDEEQDDAFAVSAFVTELNPGNVLADPQLVAPYSRETPDFRPASASAAVSGAAVPADSFFEEVSFKGGVDPNDDWTAGWTTSALN
jgi:hypothetical protein